jgi:hypothetical protein
MPQSEQDNKNASIIMTKEFKQIIDDGLIATSGSEPAYKKFLEQLESSEFTNGTNIKHIQGELFRFKVGRGNRILAVRQLVNGEII